jgi:hypothetical protein
MLPQHLVFYFYFYGLWDMDEFMIKKRMLDADNESSVSGNSSGNGTHTTASLKPSCANKKKTTCLWIHII